MIPASIEAFWVSVTNEEKLQLFLKKYIIENISSGIHFVLNVAGIEGVTKVQPCVYITDKEKPIRLYRSDISIEEANIQLIPHVLHTSKSGAIKTVVLLIKLY